MKTYSLYDLNTMVVTGTTYTIEDDEYMLEYAASINHGVYHGDAEIGSIISSDGLSIIGKATTTADIFDSLRTGGENLDLLISRLPEVMSGQVEARDWIKQHYSILRANLYPNVVDLADALVKLNSADITMKQQGESELQNYVNKCMAVKAAIPKD